MAEPSPPPAGEPGGEPIPPAPPLSAEEAPPLPPPPPPPLPEAALSEIVTGDDERAALESLRADLASAAETSSSADDGDEAQAAATATIRACAAVSDGMLLRMLRARKLDVAAARALLQDDMAWRLSEKPEAATQADIPNALPGGCWRLLGLTRGAEEETADVSSELSSLSTQFPIIWIRVGLWNPGDYGVPEYLKLIEYFVERALTVGRRFVVLFDMEGWRLSFGFHLGKISTLVSTLQNHYPERLQAALLMRTPRIFSTAWRVIEPWLDPVTAAKVAYLPSAEEPDPEGTEHGDNAELAALLAAGIPRELIPAAYGGLVDGDSIPVPNLHGEPNITAT